MEVLLDGRNLGRPVLDVLVELVDELGRQGLGEVLRLDEIVRPGVQVGGRLIIPAHHDIGFGTVEEGLVGGEGRIHRVGVTDTGHRIGVLEQVRDFPEGHLVEVGAAVPFRRLPVPGIHVPPAGLGVAPDVLRVVDFREVQEGVVGVLRDAGKAHIPAKGRVGGQQHQVRVIGRLDEVVGLHIHVLLQAVAVLPVAEHLRRLGTQALGRIFGREVPLLVEEVEPARESVGGLDVEVVLGHLIIAVVDIAEGDLEVLLDLLVDFRDRSTVVLGVQFHGNAVDIGDSEVLVAGVGVVVQAEEVDQHEVVVGAAEQRFGHFRGQSGLLDGGDGELALATGQLLDRLEGLVGVVDRLIAAFPEVLGTVVIRFRDVGPGVALVHETVGSGVVVTHVVHIVRHVLAEEQVGSGRVGGGQQRTDFLRRVDLGPVVGHLVQELVAGRQADEGDDGDGRFE